MSESQANNNLIEQENAPTLVLCSNLLDNVIDKMKIVSTELKNNHKIDLDENLTYIDIKKQLIRAQSFILFMTQGRQIKLTEKEEKIINFTMKNSNETQRNEELYANQINEHQNIIHEYKKQLNDLKKQNKLLKKLLDVYKLETNKSEEKIQKDSFENKIYYNDKNSLYSPEKFTIQRINPKPFQEEPNSNYKIMSPIKEIPKTYNQTQKFPIEDNSKKENSNKKLNKIKEQLQKEIGELDEEIAFLTEQINNYL